jgi:hypothetical protein
MNIPRSKHPTQRGTFALYMARTPCTASRSHAAPRDVHGGIEPPSTGPSREERRAGLSTVSQARRGGITSLQRSRAVVLYADSANMTFYLAQGKGLPCRRHPVISVH